MLDQPLNIILICYFLILTAVGFISMAVDKKRARKKQWRVKEKTLFIIAALGGSVGSYLGMVTFRHKTKHRKFMLGIPSIIMIQIIIIIIIIFTSFFQIY